MGESYCGISAKNARRDACSASLGEEPQDVWEQTTVYLEKFLFIKLHPIIFGRDANVSAQDDAFFKRLQSLDFLAPEHLDIKSLLLGTDRKSLDEGAAE